MTMNIKITHEGPATCHTLIETFDKNAEEAADGRVGHLVNTQHLEMGQEAAIAVHALRYVVITEIHTGEDEHETT